MDTLWYDDGWCFIFYRVIIMDNGLMEKLKDMEEYLQTNANWEFEIINKLNEIIDWINSQ